MRERGKKREKIEERKEKEEKTFRAKVEQGEMWFFSPPSSYSSDFQVVAIEKSQGNPRNK